MEGSPPHLSISVAVLKLFHTKSLGSPFLGFGERENQAIKKNFLDLNIRQLCQI